MARAKAYPPPRFKGLGRYLARLLVPNILAGLTSLTLSLSGCSPLFAGQQVFACGRLPGSHQGFRRRSLSCFRRRGKRLRPGGNRRERDGVVEASVPIHDEFRARGASRRLPRVLAGTGHGAKRSPRPSRVSNHSGGTGRGQMGKMGKKRPPSTGRHSEPMEPISGTNARSICHPGKARPSSWRFRLRRSPRVKTCCGRIASRLCGEIRSLSNGHGGHWQIASNSSPSIPPSGWGNNSTPSGIGPDDQVMTLRFAINLLVGGLLALAIRELYRRYSSTVTNREPFANMLPLFTLSTIVVISVVQYSPALALGLNGAMSIVRFRTSIASPEELVYLLLCVGLGVALGGKPFAAGSRDSGCCNALRHMVERVW